MTTTRTFQDTIPAYDVRPGMIVDIKNTTIGDYDPPMTVRVVVTDVRCARYEADPRGVEITGLAINTYDHEPYEIDGEACVPGAMSGTADGTWTVARSDEIDVVTGGTFEEVS